MRLLKRVEYEAVYGAGQRRSSPQFSVFFRAQAPLPKETVGRETPREGSSVKTPAAGRTSRFGISVKKALGGAVVRNRIKRRVRDILRRNRTEIPSGWDIVIHPKSSVARAAFAPLEAELVRLLRSIQNAFQNTGRNSSPNSLPNPSPNPAPKTTPKLTPNPRRKHEPRGAHASFWRARVSGFFFGADAERLQVLSFLLALCG